MKENEHKPSELWFHFTQASVATAFAYPARVCLSVAVDAERLKNVPLYKQPFYTMRNAWPLICQGRGFGLNYARGTSSIFLLTLTNDWMKYYVGDKTLAQKSLCFGASVLPGTAMALLFETRFIRRTSSQFNVPGVEFPKNYNSLRLAKLFITREATFTAAILSTEISVLIGSSMITSGLQRAIVLEANRDKHKITLMPKTVLEACPPNLVAWRFAYMGSIGLSRFFMATLASLGMFSLTKPQDDELKTTSPRPR